MERDGSHDARCPKPANVYSSASIRAWVAALVIVAVSSCGTGKFSEDYAQQIKSDCTQATTCQPGMPVDACVTKVSNMLDKASESQQQFFVDTVDRCGTSPNCDAYRICVATDPTAGYAGTHQAQIMHDCMQNANCNGLAGVQAQDFMISCMEETGVRVNSAPENQASYEAMFARCSAGNFLGCDWVNCRNGAAPPTALPGI